MVSAFNENLRIVKGCAAYVVAVGCLLLAAITLHYNLGGSGLLPLLSMALVTLHGLGAVWWCTLRGFAIVSTESGVNHPVQVPQVAKRGEPSASQNGTAPADDSVRTEILRLTSKLALLGEDIVSEAAIKRTAQSGVEALRGLLKRAERKKDLLKEANGLGVGHLALRTIYDDPFCRERALNRFLEKVKDLLFRASRLDCEWGNDQKNPTSVSAKVKLALLHHDLGQAEKVIQQAELRAERREERLQIVAQLEEVKNAVPEEQRGELDELLPRLRDYIDSPDDFRRVSHDGAISKYLKALDA